MASETRDRWDHVPRLQLRAGRHLFGAWAAMGRLGAVTGALVFVGLALYGDVAWWHALAIVVADLAGFLIWGALMPRWRGRRTYILLEHALIAWAMTMATATIAGADRGLVADAWVAGIALTLAMGRAGCLFMGCCHGRAAVTGVRYPWLPPWVLGPPWSDVRVVPLQVIELIGFVALCVAAVVLALHAPGWGASVIPTAYAVGRFELELWRGDQRRYIGRLSHSQWLCLLVLALVTALGVWPCGVVGLAAVTIVAAIQHRRLRRPLIFVTSPSALAQLQQAIDRARGGGATFAGLHLERDPHGAVRLDPADARRHPDVAHLVALATADGGDADDDRCSGPAGNLRK